MISKFINLLVNIILFIAVICAFVPFFPNMPSDGLDPSWQLGMGQAIYQGLAIGREIIFTFGPYAPMYTNSFHPATDDMIMLSSIWLAISYFLTLYFLSKPNDWYIKVAIFFIFGGVIYLRDPLFFSYPLLLGFYVLKSSGSKGGMNVYLIECILFLPLGLLPLIKGSNLILVLGVVFLSTVLYTIKHRFENAVIAFSVPILSFCIFWILSGQSIFDLLSYIRATQEIISGYSEAMALNGPSYEIFLYLSCAALILCHAFFVTNFNFLSRVYLVSLLGLYLFVAFKAGFVRHDGHAMIAGLSILLLTTLYLLLGFDKKKLALVFFSFCVWILIDANYAHTTFLKFSENLRNKYINSLQGAKTRLINSGELQTAFDMRLQEINKKINIPLSMGTSDIYSYGQAYLISSGNKWNPRPVFQSYSAYTPFLIKKNLDHISGESAPDNIFFRIEPIDGRFPSIEDGLSWSIFFSKYKPVEIIDQLIHLKKRGASDKGDNNLVKISSQIASFDENVLVPKSNNLIFVKIDIKKTLLGKLSELLYKLNPLVIVLNFDDGKSLTYKVHSGMTSSGFLISPFIENTADFADLYFEHRTRDYRYVKSFSVKPVSGLFYWSNSYSVEFNQVQQPQKSHNLYLSNFDDLLVNLPSMPPQVANDCIGAIDAINGLPSSKPIVVGNGGLSVRGWLAQPSGTEAKPRPAILVLSKKEAGGKVAYLKTRMVQRPDVSLAIGSTAVVNSGFESAINVTGISGNYQIGLGFIDDGVLKLCSQFQASISFGGNNGNE